MKPRIEEQSEKHEVASVPPGGETGSGKPTSAEDDIGKDPRGTTRPSAKDSETNARSETDLLAKATGSPANSSAPVASASNAARREIGPGPDSATSTAETSDPSKPPNPDEPIKRHDHSKYSEFIKNKAVELVNQQTDSDHALMCKDAITDQWSLILYYSKERAYTFVTYLWDEIDEKWQKAFVSDKRPLGGWETHLRFQSSGKECTTLKRARR